MMIIISFSDMTNADDTALYDNYEAVAFYDDALTLLLMCLHLILFSRYLRAVTFSLIRSAQENESSELHITFFMHSIFL